MLVVTVGAYAAYLAIILGRAGPLPLTAVPYVSTMLWTIGAAIVAAIVLQVVVATAAPEGANQKDQRDKEIDRFGEHIGHSFVVIGSVAKLAAYRWGFQPW